jgi:hypothetical protein
VPIGGGDLGLTTHFGRGGSADRGRRFHAPDQATYVVAFLCNAVR